MIESQADLDRMFHALSDRSRRGMIDRLGRGPASVTELAAPLAVALPTVMKHLQVLEHSGLVLSEKSGRVRTYRLQQDALATVERWVEQRKSRWTTTFDRLDQFLAEEPESFSE
ncbi:MULTISPECIES: metalloregulator ArsR/SmtB family transcription factor [unclassified Rhizobium]|uniref:ArsR/SmtB family transcription factor n=1 Tax=unclassified Rhizobium TaxID=2613769 RepID=UPI00027B83AC|nr:MULTISPECIES: metalloregulator ArsR/SmtB family transcription factor [unclassified Rhizobium]EJT05563.1 ArsR family transcriptional regulator [Rhizobium sp. CCGE 510]MBX5161207.1 winged helix-turn-helix transcriptional regulator [Rhizobium sp. NZLR8]MBX5167099.1 winged helix-turn-helix transcriptional regulator [Rhizobium sp. NZLR4b]MBX5173018.1 winged helix-turn-helix transcriptional regulator [Rhizobium sp. NZLR1b]MBX5185413.1 winged helix-turn-helix transcriptional regulator [Rhizobium s